MVLVSASMYIRQSTTNTGGLQNRVGGAASTKHTPHNHNYRRGFHTRGANERQQVTHGASMYAGTSRETDGVALRPTTLLCAKKNTPHFITREQSALDGQSCATLVSDMTCKVK